MKVDLVTNEEHDYYSQISQPSGVSYSFLNRRETDGDILYFKELHFPATCREFIGDMIIASKMNIYSPSNYGLEIGNKRMDLDSFLISLNLTYNQKENLIHNIKVIHKLERILRIKVSDRTKIYETDSRVTRNNITREKVVVDGNKIWHKSLLLADIFYLLLRFSTYNKFKSIEDMILYISNEKEGSDRTSARKILDDNLDISHLLKNQYKVFKKDPLTGINDLGFNSGFKRAGRPGCDTSISINAKIEDYTTTARPSLSAIHSSHGLYSFLDLIALIKSAMRYITPKSPKIDKINSIDNFIRYTGSKWAYNYYKILKEEGK